MQIWAIFIFLSSDRQAHSTSVWNHLLLGVCAKFWGKSSDETRPPSVCVVTSCWYLLSVGEMHCTLCRRYPSSFGKPGKRQWPHTCWAFFFLQQQQQRQGESYGHINQKVHSHLIKKKINWLNPIGPLERAVGSRHSKAAVAASSINHEQMNELFSHFRADWCWQTIDHLWGSSTPFLRHLSQSLPQPLESLDSTQNRNSTPFFLWPGGWFFFFFTRIAIIDADNLPPQKPLAPEHLWVINSNNMIHFCSYEMYFPCVKCVFRFIQRGRT